MLTVGLVHNWPGKKNSELDLIVRIIAVLDTLGHRALVIDPVGQLLDVDGNPTDKAADEQTLDLVINLHYTNPKWLDALSSCVNCTPLEYILDDPFTGKPVSEPHLRYLLDCMRSHDRMLSAGSSTLDRFAAQVRTESTQRLEVLEEPLALHTTIQHDAVGERQGWVSPASASTFYVFYIGTNWEKTFRSRRTIVRHKGLFERLGESGRFRFYGLRKQNGIPLWKGVEGYQGELPFDGGQSIIRESRRCGVALVPSSRQHLRSGVVSTRIFQASAAGVVIISDRNPFVQAHFGDSVLYFDYGANSEETAASILGQVSWVEENWDAAVAMAERAQALFLKRFTLENEVTAICSQAVADLARVRALDAAAADRQIRIHYVARRFDEPELNRLLENIARQRHKNVVVSLYHASGEEAAFGGFVKRQKAVVFQLHTRDPLALRAGATLAVAVGSGADFHLWYSEGFDWRCGHLSNLLTACADGGSTLSYSPFFAHFGKLFDEEEKQHYFITGLDGGYRRLTKHSVDALDMTRFPLGNMLVSNQQLEAVSEQLAGWSLYDLLAPFLLLREACQADDTSVRFSPVITAHCRLTDDKVPNFAYSEYDYLPGPWCDGRERDRRLFIGLARGGSLIADRDDTLTVADISRWFSLFAYLRHLFEDRPAITRLLWRIQRMLTRVS